MTRTITILAALAATGFSGSVAALDWDWGGLEGRLTNKLSAGATMRMSDRDADLVGIANGGRAFSTNGDDGNLAWDKGELVSGAVKLTSDLTLNWGDVGLFVRGSGLYNPVLDNKDYFDAADYQPNAQKEFGLDEKDRKEVAVREHVGADGDLLDAYLFYTSEVWDRYFSIRLGRQILNWGESTLVQNGINSILSFDANQLRVPGFEFEEITVPAGMAWLSMDVVENVSVEGFYQFQWEPTIIDASGTFWSTNDFAGIGGTQANLGFGRAGENSDGTTECAPPPDADGPGPLTGSFCVPFGSTVPRATDVEPDDGGQYGGALRLFLPWLGNSDVSFYAMNYHSRLPLFSGTSRAGPGSPADGANYFVEYPEDIQLYGVSFNTTIEALDIALQGEYSYKLDQPLQIDDVELLLAGLGAGGQISPVPGASLGGQYLRGWRRHDVDQYDLSFTRIFGPTIGWDQLTLFAEAAMTRVHGMPDASVLAYEAPATYTFNEGSAALNSPGAASGLPVTPYEDYATPTSWGYKVAARLAHNNLFGAWSSEQTILWQHDVNGTTPTPIANFVEGSRTITFLVAMTYLNSWTVGMGYTNYFGAAEKNLRRDRDFLEYNVKYSF